MEFERIQLDGWARREHFEHYRSQVPCTYSMTTKLDITALVEAKARLYPAMLYLLTRAVNRFPEFRMDFDSEGKLGVYSEMHPCYTIFHRDSETFSNLWTEYTEDYQVFFRAYERDLEQFGGNKSMMAKPGVPANTFPVSMIPWESFDGFNLNLEKGYGYLLPIFTMGRYSENNGRYLLPLSIQVNHAVCDGFHVCRFISALREMIDGNVLGL
ncbi:MAG: type A chloramphenicol O-acetyltransferase [Pseudoflavonifractor capillosus]|uniref:type A chloramphenicol O-acetyltransferase n=1 Tax=Pseudoflavonifractor capillosus TaxID=106588 RepID=UPI0023FA42F3|nr:type A chloramphenicol O-acetyltransferase [Pseudoflavonifractor capillosus]MCI5927644.1 type A chloramphenicol O-acetyltransferase [Pseudoflavonifractor capillosus]MDY4662442.1 type A chloramphenicol O-acetyltransferase [Pseudoflavonifractor capillosus]